MLILYGIGKSLSPTGCSYNVNSILDTGLVVEGKESKDGRETSHFSLNYFGENPDEEEPSNGLSVPSKVHHIIWKYNQDAAYWVKLSRAQEQGLQFRQTKSNATIVHSHVPADCISKIICEKGDRALFERLPTPRFAPKMTLWSRWQAQPQQPQQPQQQQQPQLSESASTSTWQQARGIFGRSGSRDKGSIADTQCSNQHLTTSARH